MHMHTQLTHSHTLTMLVDTEIELSLPLSSPQAMAMPSSAASSPHSTMQQHLSSLLWQRGPNALPYSEDVKLLIRQHLLDLMQELPTLRAKPSPFVHNNGVSVNLLLVEGTIPMTFHGVSYNIPVIIWLLEPYPKGPPLVFVSPTKDMVIKRLHRHVDASGMVSLPYLHSWFYPRSNLADLARSLSSMFSQDPPLFSKRSSPSSKPQHHRSSPATSPSSSAGSANSASQLPSPARAGIARDLSSMFGQDPPLLFKPLSPSSQVCHHCLSPAASPPSSAGSANLNPYINAYQLPSPARPQMQQLPPSPLRTESPGSTTPSRPASARSRRTENASEVFRRDAIDSLVERLKLDTSELRKAGEMDMEKLSIVQSQLTHRKDHLNKGIQQLQKEKDGLKEQLRIILTNADMLRSWLKTHGASSLDIVVDDAFEPCDALSKQMLECTSMDLALEDVLYSLDKAVQEGAVPVDVYLKQVRSLAREQFFHRAISAKIQAAQQQIQVSNMAEHGMACSCASQGPCTHPSSDCI